MTSGPWLLTGASGFLGRHVLQTLFSTQPRPVVLLLRDPKAWAGMPWTRPLSPVELVTGSITEVERWQDAPELQGLNGILHLAALVRHTRRDAAEVEHVNVEGTLAMVRLAAQQRCRMILVSTSGTVGCFRRPGLSADEDAPTCDAEVERWPYYRSKLRAEREARRLASTLGVTLVIVRPPVLLGPGDHRLRSTGHVLRLLEGRLPFLVRGGMHFADVRDVAAALLRLLDVTDPRPVYHLPGTVCSITEFYRMTARAAGRRPPRLVVPFRVAWGVTMLADHLGRLMGKGPLGGLPEPALVEMAARHWAVHSRFAEAELGYKSRPAKETLADTVEELRREGRTPADRGEAARTGFH